MSTIRRAMVFDLPGVEKIYGEIHDAEEAGITRGQITFHEDAAFQNEIMSESEIIRYMI